MPSFSLSTLSPPDHEEDMVDRLAKIEYENPICANCPATCPRWVSFLRDHFGESTDENKKKKKEGRPKLEVEGKLCVVVCDNCAIQHHMVLSNRRCMIKSLECIHEWTHNEVDIVLGSGNDLTNLFYEADLLICKSFIAEEEMLPNFIKQKYKRHKFRDDKMLENYLRVAQKKGIKKAKNRFLSEGNKVARRKTCAGNEIRRSMSAPNTASPIKEVQELRSPGLNLGLRRSRTTEVQGSRRGSMPTLMEEYVSDTITPTTNQQNEVWESKGGRQTPSSVTRAAGSVMRLVPNDSCYRRRSSRTSRVASKAIGKIPAFLSHKSTSASSMPTSLTSAESNLDEGVPVSINASETKSVSSLGSFGSSATRTAAFSEEYHNNLVPISVSASSEEMRIVSTVGRRFWSADNNDDDLLPSLKSSSQMDSLGLAAPRNGFGDQDVVSLADTKSVSTLGTLGSTANTTSNCSELFATTVCESSCGMTKSEILMSASEGTGIARRLGSNDYDDECSSRRSSTSSISSRRSVTWGSDSILSMCSDEPPMSCRPSLRRVQTLPARPKVGILRKTHLS